MRGQGRNEVGRRDGRGREAWAGAAMRLLAAFAVALCAGGIATADPTNGSAGSAAEHGLGPGRLQQLIAASVAASLELPAESVRVELLGRVPELPADEGTECTVASRGAGPCVGSVPFDARISRGGVLVREETVRARVEVLQEVVVAARSLPRDATLTEDDVRLASRWVRELPVRAATSTADVVGKRLGVALPTAGEIQRGMLREVILVKRGKAVRIELDEGGLHISALGTSEEDGAQGALIKVRNSSSNRTLWARVVAPAAVRVEF
jgi:flagella basal body P-ring formation protein FlgA